MYPPCGITRAKHWILFLWFDANLFTFINFIFLQLLHTSKMMSIYLNIVTFLSSNENAKSCLIGGGTGEATYLVRLPYICCLGLTKDDTVCVLVNKLKNKPVLFPQIPAVSIFPFCWYSHQLRTCIVPKAAVWRIYINIFFDYYYFYFYLFLHWVRGHVK